MLLNNNKMMLIYGFDAKDRYTLDNIIKKAKLPSYRVVDKTMAKMTVKNMLDGLRFELGNITVPDERVILFNNFSDYEIDIAINLIKDSLETMPIFAAVTPMSINWEFNYLLNHLVEEREWHKKHQG